MGNPKYLVNTVLKVVQCQYTSDSVLHLGYVHEVRRASGESGFSQSSFEATTLFVCFAFLESLNYRLNNIIYLVEYVFIIFLAFLLPYTYLGVYLFPIVSKIVLHIHSKCLKTLFSEEKWIMNSERLDVNIAVIKESLVSVSPFVFP